MTAPIDDSALSRPPQDYLHVTVERLPDQRWIAKAYHHTGEPEYIGDAHYARQDALVVSDRVRTLVNAARRLVGKSRLAV